MRVQGRSGLSGAILGRPGGAHSPVRPLSGSPTRLAEWYAQSLAVLVEAPGARLSDLSLGCLPSGEKAFVGSHLPSGMPFAGLSAVVLALGAVGRAPASSLFLPSPP